MLTELQYRLLRRVAPSEPRFAEVSAYSGKSKLLMALGDDLPELIHGRTVIDFGCGEGAETLDLIRYGAKKAIGLDIRENVLDIAARRCEAEGLSARCEFVTATNTEADVIVSLDAFEHFGDPAAILALMHRLLKPGGLLLASFGPTWYHPLGGHLFSVFPWAHLLFSEDALIRWRSHIRSDGATTFAEVEGGLNQMTIARFERLVAAGGFTLESLETVPIRPLRPLHCRLTRELTTALVRSRLIRKA